MENNLIVLKEWEDSIIEFNRLKLSSAKEMYKRYKDEKNPVKKKEILDELVKGTLYVVVRFIKGSGLIFFSSSEYDMNDIINSCNEVWIDAISSGRIDSIISYGQLFDSSYINRVCESMGISTDFFFERTRLRADVFSEIVSDYIQAKKIDSDVTPASFIEKTDKRTYSLHSTVSAYRILKLIDVLISNIDIDDLELSKYQVDKLKYFIISSGLLYMDDEEEMDMSDELINKMIVQEYMGNIFSSDVLDESRKSIIRDRFGFTDGQCHTLKEVAAKNHLTRERIRQKECKSLRIIRGSKISRDYRRMMIKGVYDD